MKPAGFLLIFCMLLSVYAYAQETTNCESLLKREPSKDTPQQILQQVVSSKCFGLDSVDLKIFGYGPVLGGIMAKIATKKNSGTLTYQDIFNEISREKADPGYAKVRNEIIAMNALEKMKAAPDTWGKALPLLRTIGKPPDEIFNMHEFMLRHVKSGWNYHQLIVFYEDEQRKEDGNKPK